MPWAAVRPVFSDHLQLAVCWLFPRLPSSHCGLSLVPFHDVRNLQREPAALQGVPDLEVRAQICLLLLVPLGDVENELVDNRMVVRVLTVRHGSTPQQRLIHEARQRVQRKVLARLFLVE